MMGQHPMQVAQQQQLHGYDYHYSDAGLMPSSIFGAAGEEWAEIVRVSASAMPTSETVTAGAVAFDRCHEMLWVGCSDGRLTSYLLPTLDKYTSVTSNPGSIKQLVPTYGGVVAISDHAATIRSRGCVQTHAIVVDGARQITCGSLNIHDPIKPSDVLLVGTDAGLLSAYDLHGYHPLQPMWFLDLHVSTAALASSDDSPLICAGSSQGRLDFFDGDHRSHRVAASIPLAHSGSIVTIDVMDNYVLTCGISSRSINPYDKYAPVKIYPDPLVKLFDVRTMSLVSSIPFPSSTGLPPIFVKFHMSENAFYAADAGGDLVLFDMVDPMQYSLVGHLHPSVTAFDASLSGELIATGSRDGTVVMYDSGLSTSPRALLDEPEDPLEFPRPASRPPLTLSPLEPAPASRYVFRPSVDEFGQEITPLSAWLPSTNVDNTFKLNMTLVVAPKPTKVLHPEFEKKVQQKHTIGFTSHRGYDRNSFVFGKGRATALATVDPRSAETTPRRRDSVSRSIGSAKSFDEADPLWHVPPSYKYTEINMSKHSMDGFVFDFSKHNQSSTHVGFENALPYAYMNAALQLLYATPGVRTLVLAHLCDDASCVRCELGFLFHMMAQTTSLALQKNRSVQITNFLSALHQIHGVAAAGLFDKTLSILVRVDRFFALLCRYLDLVSPTLHHVVLPPLPDDDLTFESLVAKHVSPDLPLGGEFVAVSCDPASWLLNDDIKERWATPGWVPVTLTLPTGETYTLIGVISAVVRNVVKSHLISGPNAHLVTHVVGPDGLWMLLNDFTVSESSVDDAINFSPPWKYPSVLLYRREGSPVVLDTTAPPAPIPSTIFDAAPLNPTVARPRMSTVTLPKKGDRVAIDTEFVIVEMEEATLQTDGTRVVIKESRQSLARVSVIHGETDAVLVDDYILPNEPVREDEPTSELLTMDRLLGCRLLDAIQRAHRRRFGPGAKPPSRRVAQDGVHEAAIPRRRGVFVCWAWSA
ncbi:hypothetical protein, variant 1 [Aphanomyces invadans]|uniref:Uncharacterized protein n=1 Tax=Aphanomyces invadans TaxID=157072 RepID=A0A024U9K3_9STRA|nr:hypothetical protein, variant 1 [Aphanomyces invadans]ETW03111.1 hypothetical protein, variant 1 [Aphanomyces invadans]|eukprot:XP_008868495.1 hypothetical protein, variant 1 [Aphanomyces invadans]